MKNTTTTQQYSVELFLKSFAKHISEEPDRYYEEQLAEIAARRNCKIEEIQGFNLEELTFPCHPSDEYCSFCSGRHLYYDDDKAVAVFYNHVMPV